MVLGHHPQVQFRQGLALDVGGNHVSTEVGPIALIELHPALAVAVHDRHRRGRLNESRDARFDTCLDHVLDPAPGGLDKVRFLLGNAKGKGRGHVQHGVSAAHDVGPSIRGQQVSGVEGQARQGLRCVGAQGPLEHGPNVVGAVHPPQGASDVVAPAKGFQRYVAAEKASDARDHEGRVLQSVAHDRGRRWIHL